MSFARSSALAQRAPLFMCWFVRAGARALALSVVGMAVNAAQAQSIGGALDELTRKLPGKVQGAARKALDPSAGQNGTSASPGQTTPAGATPGTAAPTAQRGSNGAIDFPNLPCVSTSNVQALGKAADLTNNCGHDVSVLYRERGSATCHVYPLAAGKTKPFAPVAVCDFKMLSLYAPPACDCEAAAKAGGTASTPTPKTASSDQAASASCIAPVQIGGSARLKNKCDRDLMVLEKATTGEGCRLRKFNRHFMASVDAVAICDGGQKGKSCDCDTQTVWRHP